MFSKILEVLPTLLESKAKRSQNAKDNPIPVV